MSDPHDVVLGDDELIITKQEYERLRRIEEATRELMSVLDLASSVHTPRRRAARLKLREALSQDSQGEQE